jgi:DNA-nicking Smr family endonuclease
MTKKPSSHKKTISKKASSKVGDEDLWGHVAASIKPLQGRHKNRAPEVELDKLAIKLTPKGAGARKLSSRGPLADTNETVRRTSLPELNHEKQTGLDKSSAKKLKKGQHRIEGRIDLHGMTQEQAHRALNSFIDGSYAATKRCVLVITGKGLKSDGTVGVIRSAVPGWLNQSPNRERVIAFSYATPKDGGEGALYVMLKRKR